MRAVKSSQNKRYMLLGYKNRNIYVNPNIKREAIVVAERMENISFVLANLHNLSYISNL